MRRLSSSVLEVNDQNEQLRAQLIANEQTLDEVRAENGRSGIPFESGMVRHRCAGRYLRDSDRPDPAENPLAQELRMGRPLIYRRGIDQAGWIEADTPVKNIHVSITESGIQRDAIDPLVDEPAGEIGMIRRPLSADTDIFPLFPAGFNGHFEQHAHGFVALIEEVGDQRRVAVQAQRQLGHIVRADRHAVEIFEVLLREKCVGRQFTTS